VWPHPAANFADIQSFWTQNIKRESSVSRLTLSRNGMGHSFSERFVLTSWKLKDCEVVGLGVAGFGESASPAQIELNSTFDFLMTSLNDFT
jgi:hypothetical protein